MTALCTQLLGQSGGLGGLYLPTSQQPAYAARFGDTLPADNLALGGSPALVFGAPAVTVGAPGILPSIALNAGNTPAQYIDTGVQDTTSITVLAIAKSANTAALGNSCVIASNFNSDETGTLQFYLNNSGVIGVFSTATTGLNNQQAGISLTQAQTTAWGLYALRISTTAAGSTLDIRALTAGQSATVSAAPRYVPVTGAKTLQIGYTPAHFFNGAINVAEPIIFQYALTDDELAGVAQIIRARAEQFGVTV